MGSLFYEKKKKIIDNMGLFIELYKAEKLKPSF